jgi:hypothetical protein
MDYVHVILTTFCCFYVRFKKMKIHNIVALAHFLIYCNTLFEYPDGVFISKPECVYIGIVAEDCSGINQTVSSLMIWF